MPFKGFREPIREPTPKLEKEKEKEKEKSLIRILVIEDNPEYIKDFEELEKEIKKLDLPIIETYRGDEESKKDWKRGLLTLIKEVIIPKRKKENLDYSDLEDIAEKIESIEEIK